MAAGDATLHSFLPGSVVGAYKEADIRNRAEGNPDIRATAVATATTDSDGVTSFTGLTQEQHYAALVSTDTVITVTVNATAGEFRLRFGTETIVDVAYNVSAANLKTAIAALDAFAAADLTVTGGPGDSGGTTPYVITIAAAYKDTDVATPQGLNGTTPLSGGGASITVAKTTAGGAGGDTGGRQDSKWVKFLPVAS